MKMPKHILDKVNKANMYAWKAEQLNIEVEDWLEKNGVQDGYAELFDIREHHGMSTDIESFVKYVESL